MPKIEGSCTIKPAGRLAEKVVVVSTYMVPMTSVTVNKREIVAGSLVSPTTSFILRISQPTQRPPVISLLSVLTVAPKSVDVIGFSLLT